MLGGYSVRRRLPRALHGRDFALFIVVVLAMNVASQMIAVAIGWQVYAVRHRAFDLGLIGLLEFAPLFLLALPAGALADRLPRRLVLACACTLMIAVAALLIVVSEDGAHTLWPFLALAVATGVATALSFPATRAMPPALVTRDLLPSALALRSVATQIGMVAGPALGGLLFALAPEAAYGAALALFGVATVAVLAVRLATMPQRPAEPTTQLRALFSGIRFIGDTPILLGAILLDLFAVLFGGAVALLPVFAQSVLHTGPAGLGLLRSAPAVGAVAAGAMLVRGPLRTPAGPTLIAAVSTFGASIVVFGLSHWLALSLVALAISGGADMISVNVRTTTATMVTPDYVRGRVGAVEAVFVGASNQLGAFESGTAAALLGAVPAVVAGGAVTIAIALSWTQLFPQLAKLRRMADLRPLEPGHSDAPLAAAEVEGASAR